MRPNPYTDPAHFNPEWKDPPAFDYNPEGNPSPPSPPDPVPGPSTPPPPQPPPSPPTPRDPIDRLADLFERMFGQTIALPSPGQPQLIPQPTTSGGVLPILLIIGGLGIIGYMVYQKKKKGGTDASSA